MESFSGQALCRTRHAAHARRRRLRARGSIAARRRSADLGLSMLEVVVSATLVVAILFASATLFDSSRSLASSLGNERTAMIRVDRSLTRLKGDIRSASLATASHLDGSSFDDGDTGAGLSIRTVRANGAAPALLTTIVFSYDSARGELVRRQGQIETVVARGITAFTVTRDDTAFVFSVTSAAGPEDDRGRTSRGSLRVVARNP